MEKEEKDIELRCEEVQEILTRPPHALVRWGITVFFTVLALFFIGGCFFKYPDVVSAEITVTTEHPPVWKWENKGSIWQRPGTGESR